MKTGTKTCTCMTEEDGSVETPSGSCPEHGWMADEELAAPAPELWHSNGGHVVCRDHGGAEFTSYLRAHPRATRFTTPLDSWRKVTDEDRDDWAAMNADAVADGEDDLGPMSCESCR